MFLGGPFDPRVQDELLSKRPAQEIVIVTEEKCKEDCHEMSCIRPKAKGVKWTGKLYPSG